MEHVNQNKINLLEIQQIKNKMNPAVLTLNKFINLIMIDGKKTKAIKLFNNALTLLQKRVQLEMQNEKNKNISKSKDVLHIVFQAISNVTPCLEVRKVRRAGTTYLVPAMVSDTRGRGQGIRWIIEAARERRKNKSLSFAQCLAEELYLAANKQGKAREKRKELHNIALANRAFARYRWW